MIRVSRPFNIRRASRATALAIALIAMLGTAVAEAPRARLVDGRQGKIVVANRGSGTLSVIDVDTDAVVATVSLPAGDQTAEPMYVNYSAPVGRVFVGDRAHDRVVVLSAGDLTPLTTVSAGRGVFHQWQSPPKTQFWVNNDVDNTATVIDAVSLEVLATVPMPSDLVERGGKPHDVIVDPVRPYAYVSMLGFAGASDYVVQFNTRTFEETARAAVGKDPHLSLAFGGDALYVPCQNTDEVIVLDLDTLNEIDRLQVPGAHGAGMALRGDVFYTTNLTGGGIEALYAIDTASNELLGEAADSPHAVPHNIALTPDGTKLYVTHSGPTADKVSVFALDSDGVPTFVTSINVGLNPFGLAYVP